MRLLELKRRVLLIDAGWQGGSSLDWKAARGGEEPAFTVVGLPNDSIHRGGRRNERHRGISL